TRHVVVNLSYGPTTRPHDGRSNLEFVMSLFTAFFDGSADRPKLDIVLAAGNSRLRDWHVVHDSSSASGPRATWTWRVPPDNPVPVFAEIWVPKGQEAHVSGRLLAPVTGVPYVGQLPFIGRAESPCSTSYGWLIVLPPTQGKPLATPPGPSPSAPDGDWTFNSTSPAGPAPAPGSLPNQDDLPPGPHGNWQLELSIDAADVQAHAYIARSDPNMGARLAAKPTRFVDAAWEKAQGAKADYRLVDGVRDLNGSLVRRDGTLNGIATVVAGGVHVAAGYRLRDQLASRYSSRGPSRGPRPGPDCAFACDESTNLLGIRAGGNRSGTVFRLVGTSTAAPQFARQIANGVALKTGGTDVPATGVGVQPSP
ncbi:MAG: hypothetical protein JSS56_25935, partial [Proteobacteria bacterium]|nr:hypothetical protein [Pseudomonadota bacterium]